MGDCTILILGGYGTFGGRLAQLICEAEGAGLIIAGRSLAKAEEFRAHLPNAAAHRAAAIDRDGDLADQIRPLGADVIVDATGPFQAYGARPYRVVEAALELGIPYLDLADGADFVAGIDRFDAEARRKGIFVLAGVSSFPVLTAAVLRELSQGMAQIDSLRGGIAPSPYAGVGRNVIRAIASYAGQEVAMLRQGKPARPRALIDSLRYTIAPPGRLPLRNILFSLVDVPDLRAIPARYPQLREVWMGAGPVPEVLHRGLGLLARLVALGLLPSLAPFAGLFYWAINRLRWGEHRGGMFVAVFGYDAQLRKIARSWHMVAEGDDGPLIPSMAAEAILRKMLAGGPPAPGARAAIAELELDDYRALFAGRRIVEGTRDDLDAVRDLPLYRRILGQAYATLPPSLQAMHDLSCSARASGRAKVTRGRHPLARLVAALFRFPAAAEDVPVSVTFTVDAASELWRRSFAGHSFSSTQRAGTGSDEYLIVERFGIFDFALAVVLADGRLELVLRGWRCLGLPLPRSWAPRGDAYEMEAEGRFRFSVAISHPLCGLIVRYEGWLDPPQPI
ncbi:MAG TPA: DUF4166 domain-containing protein [Alphaproteobacteria bacterium]|nr:DUF4166 domain-containing protein [Alphaproteobacteria bacterium]